METVAIHDERDGGYVVVHITLTSWDGARNWRAVASNAGEPFAEVTGELRPRRPGIDAPLVDAFARRVFEQGLRMIIGAIAEHDRERERKASERGEASEA